MKWSQGHGDSEVCNSSPFVIEVKFYSRTYSVHIWIIGLVTRTGYSLFSERARPLSTREEAKSYALRKLRGIISPTLKELTIELGDFEEDDLCLI